VSGTRVTNCVRPLRLAGGLTQQELATRVEVTRQTIIAIEKGRYAPSLELAFRIAHVLVVPLQRLFQYEPDEPG